MNIFKLSYRNMISRPLSTTLCLVLLTLGVGMISLLLQVNHHIEQQMGNNVRGIDMVVGAKGSPLQLILSAVYHIDAPTGNISMKEAEKLKRNRLVAAGIPLSYGDSYKGYRIVGTSFDYPKLYEGSLASGRLWQKPNEVTIGAMVAKNLGLKLGDAFVGSHGLAEGGEVHDEQRYEVVGILNYSNAVLDQLILTATESVWEVHHHEDEVDHTAKSAENREPETQEENHSEEHIDEREITAMLIQFRNPMGIVQLPRMINQNTNMQAAVPAYEISRLFSLMGVGIDMLSTIALVIMAVSGLSIFISLYSALKDREYEMALLRAYGSTRWQLVWLVLQEGLLLTLSGFVLGIISSRIGLWFISVLMEADFHYSFSGWIWLKEEWGLLLTVLIIGLLSSLLPAIRVFHINISRTLADA
ncbi:ABC transporter permease [Reichenbachiella agarivorans]|uniref:ABC transporter permease n=1 Tax=Reichenbachiella agarivorans TaxID=2979464 RepID=A0ABY6CJT5_9BACT|nr:ABC transporter permease [Reichenbachiella agarivorans]UXP30782.1 ABC transporter permease [Reichenbachiella agarivorans]